MSIFHHQFLFYFFFSRGILLLKDWKYWTFYVMYGKVLKDTETYKKKYQHLSKLPLILLFDDINGCVLCPMLNNIQGFGFHYKYMSIFYNGCNDSCYSLLNFRMFEINMCYLGKISLHLLYIYHHTCDRWKFTKLINICFPFFC